mmetsp:Transcript_17142/g.31252  ORF Transcript_17142/g.31252 Transcript_17142/m.31252 type:complete len:208 (-) Transcript_17142:504-1127(-)
MCEASPFSTMMAIVDFPLHATNVRGVVVSTSPFCSPPFLTPSSPSSCTMKHPRLSASIRATTSGSVILVNCFRGADPLAADSSFFSSSSFFFSSSSFPSSSFFSPSSSSASFSLAPPPSSSFSISPSSASFMISSSPPSSSSFTAVSTAAAAASVAAAAPPSSPLPRLPPMAKDRSLRNCATMATGKEALCLVTCGWTKGSPSWANR